MVAVVLPSGTHLDGVADSKVLTAALRQRLDVEIRRRAVGIGVVEADEVDRLNIYRAGLTACRRALEALPLVPGFVLVDGRAPESSATGRERLNGENRGERSLAAGDLS